MLSKRAVKGLALALLLGLCLGLTGCYIPPDQISDDTQNLTVGSDSLPFDSLAPSPTATPTPTPRAQTTSDTGTSGDASTGDATATPTVNWDAGWEGASTTATASTGSSQGGITVITSAPTATPKATATPTSTSNSLRNGSTGTAVKTLQQRLKTLGYYTGSVDGTFGDATEAAVTAFQQANGLTADGVAGPRTVAKLYSDSAVKASSSGQSGSSSSSQTATPKATSASATATPSTNHYLKVGITGKNVRTLQNRLIELGWMAGTADGEFGGATEAAVIAFQQKSGLYDDGIAGPSTLEALYSSSAAKSSKPVSSIGETLELGSDSSAVRALQTRLKMLGYLTDNADGSFGTKTQQAVIAFQTNNGLTADGKAGTATLNKLYSADAVTASGSAYGSTGSSSSAATTTASTSGSSATLQEGDTGSEVKKLQQRLKDLGYYTGSVDGTYGSGTASAVEAFQRANNLTVDGKAGVVTQTKLYASSVSSSSTTYTTIEEYDEGSDVVKLQTALYELGYYDGSINGIYGTTTRDAVRAFQINNNLTVDGVAGNSTLQKLYSSSAVSATSATTEYTTLRLGDTGDEVVQLQDVLMSLGYMTTSATGVYDDLTVQAVTLFQSRNGLNADGVAGAETQTKLYSDSAVAYN